MAMTHKPHTVTPSAAHEYVALYMEVIRAVSDCEGFVTPATAERLEALEKRIPARRIEGLRNVARRQLDEA